MTVKLPPIKRSARLSLSMNPHTRRDTSNGAKFYRRELWDAVQNVRGDSVIAAVGRTWPGEGWGACTDPEMDALSRIPGFLPLFTNEAGVTFYGFGSQAHSLEIRDALCRIFTDARFPPQKVSAAALEAMRRRNPDYRRAIDMVASTDARPAA